MKNTLFTIALIDYLSDKTNFQELEKVHSSVFNSTDYNDIEDSIFDAYNTFIYKTWVTLDNITPTTLNIKHWLYKLRFNIDKILTVFCSGNIHISSLSLYGYNAMRWAIRWKFRDNYWFFRPPHIVFWGYKNHFNIGTLFNSPDATPNHPEAKVFYGNCDRY